MFRLYQDQMDSSRRVKPVEERRDSVVCRVYFRETGFAGKTEIAKALFEENNARIGFTLVQRSR